MRFVILICFYYFSVFSSLRGLMTRQPLDLSRITLLWANIKKWGQGSVGQFHTNHCILSTRASSCCLCLQEYRKGLLASFSITLNAILLSDRQPYTLLTFFFRYPAALRLDRKSILLGLLPSPCLRCASSGVPLLCAYFSPGDGRGDQSIVQCGTADERRNGNYRADHLDVRLVLLGYNIPNYVPV